VFELIAGERAAGLTRVGGQLLLQVPYPQKLPERRPDLIGAVLPGSALFLEVIRFEHIHSHVKRHMQASSPNVGRPAGRARGAVLLITSPPQDSLAMATRLRVEIPGRSAVADGASVLCFAGGQKRESDAKYHQLQPGGSAHHNGNYRRQQERHARHEVQDKQPGAQLLEADCPLFHVVIA
jgi:hypothetical protein